MLSIGTHWINVPLCPADVTLAHSP